MRAINITRHFQRAKAEIDAANEFDVQIINDEFNEALDRLEQTVFSATVVE